MIEICSQHLTIVKIVDSDWPLFKRLYSDQEILRLCFDVPSNEEVLNKFQSRLLPWTAASEHWLCLVIRENLTGNAIGITGLIVQGGVAEVGYLLLPEYSGRQYATESLQALLEYASRNFEIKEFSAVVTQGNVASERVLEKCGFKLLKTVNNAHQISGQYYDDHVYQLFILNE